MICTCTLNPSLDYYMELSEPVAPGKKNRSSLEYYEAGGKGINVSIVLNNLEIPSRATGFLGGFTKEYYITLLQKYAFVQPNFTYVEGHTRINVKMSDSVSETDINAEGPYITSDDMNHLARKVARLGEGDYFVLAGMCPQYLTEAVIDMLKTCIEDGVRVCLDTNREIMDRVLPCGPFLIKTTQEEMSAAIGEELDRSGVHRAANELHEKGAKNVLVLDAAGKNALLVCDEGHYVSEMIGSQPAVNTVGSGDSLLAGFLMQYVRGGSVVDSFRFGSCCGSATAYSKGLATRDKIESFYDQITVQKVEE